MFAERLAARYTRLVAPMAIAAGLTLLAFEFATEDGGRTIFGPGLGGDFPAFYMAGQIVAEGNADRLYDIPTQARHDRALRPNAPEDSLLTYPCAPFLALLLAPLAYLPYEPAFAVWLVMGLSCYALAIALLDEPAFRGRGPALIDSELAALSFFPFLIECWIGGQTSWMAVLVFAAAIRLETRQRCFFSGCVLAFCLYKPTLLTLVVPMLVATRRLRTLAGFAAGALLLAAVSLLLVGPDGAADYRNLLASYAEARRVAPDVFRSWKYVDFLSFLRLIFGNEPSWPIAVWGIVAAAIGGALLRLWWRRPFVGRRDDASPERGLPMAWAAALACTPLLNPHFGIYDTVIVVPAAMIALGAASASRRADAFPMSRHAATIVLGCYLATWFTQPLAMTIGFQLYTVCLAALGLLCMAQLRDLRPATRAEAASARAQSAD